MNTSTIVHEAYSFVCLSCGHGWERAYEIHHVTDLHGNQVCHYYHDGERVPSPFTRPRCEQCEGNRLRILRAGRVASATPPTGASAPISGPSVRHWHLRLPRR
jgi:hypothetical protein